MTPYYYMRNVRKSDEKVWAYEKDNTDEMLSMVFGDALNSVNKNEQ